jgi:hypothetical protein
MQLQRAARDLARIDRGMGHRAAEHLLHGEQPVAVVQEHHREHLVRQAPQVQRRVVLHLRRRVEHRPRRQLLAERPARQLQHRRQLRAPRRAEPAHVRQVRRLGLQQPRQPAAAFQQSLRQAQHTLARQPGAQQQRQQLGVGQRGRASGQQLLARAGIGGQVLQGHWGAAGKIGPVYRCRASTLDRHPAGVLPDPALPPVRP